MGRKREGLTAGGERQQRAAAVLTLTTRGSPVPSRRSPMKAEPVSHTTCRFNLVRRPWLLALMTAAWPCLSPPALAATRTWDAAPVRPGATRRTGRSAMRPPTATTLVFPYAALHKTTTNDLSKLLLHSLTFGGSNYAPPTPTAEPPR